MLGSPLFRNWEKRSAGVVRPRKAGPSSLDEGPAYFTIFGLMSVACACLRDRPVNYLSVEAEDAITRRHPERLRCGQDFLWSGCVGVTYDTYLVWVDTCL